ALVGRAGTCRPPKNPVREAAGPACGPCDRFPWSMSRVSGLICMSGLTIELAALSPGLNRLRLDADPQDLGLESSDWPGRVTADLSVEKNGDRVSIRGRLEGVVSVECVRCLRPCQLSVTVPVEVFAERAGTGSRHEEQELERDSYMRFHDGRHIDLNAE